MPDELRLWEHYTANSFRPEIDELLECGFLSTRSRRRYIWADISYHVPTNVFRIGHKVADIPSINDLKMLMWDKGKR